MKAILKIAAAALLFATPLAAHPHKPVNNNSHNHHGNFKPHVHQPTTITVSCFRGPTGDVIWDRPNAVFIDSLVAAGYTFATAHAIGERVCRDENLVGKPDAMADTMRRIFADPASHGDYNH